jgi:hypothetical protein
MSGYADMLLAITDGTFIEWLYSNDEYTDKRHELYVRWRKLCTEYQKLEFDILLLTKQKG